MRGSVFFMYHEVGQHTVGEPRYVVSLPTFKAELDHLYRKGYEVLGVAAALLLPPTDRPRVVLTFDDGNASDRHRVAPLLLDRGFSATFYVAPGLLGTPGYLTETELIELAQLGLEIGSHSKSHRYLTSLDATSLEDEVLGSKVELEEILDRPVMHFSCPGGRVTPRVREVVQKAGYLSLATSHVGINSFGSDPFRLSRVTVYRHTPLEEFVRLCQGEGLLKQGLPKMVWDAAKVVLGDRSYDLLRHALLHNRDRER